jgi:hypothetical protein
MDEITNQRCPQFVLAGEKAMLSHLNTAHGVSGSEKAPMVCRWAVLRSGNESACGDEFQRRTVPRHIRKHLGLRCICDLCDKSYARSDQLKSHRRKDHQAQNNGEMEAKLQMVWVSIRTPCKTVELTHHWPGFSMHQARPYTPVVLSKATVHMYRCTFLCFLNSIA